MELVGSWTSGASVVQRRPLPREPKPRFCVPVTPFFTTVAPAACANARAGANVTPVPAEPDVPTIVIVTVSGFAPVESIVIVLPDDEAGDARQLDVRVTGGGRRRQSGRGRREVVDAAAARVLAARVVVGVVRAVDHDVMAVAAAVRGPVGRSGVGDRVVGVRPVAVGAVVLKAERNPVRPLLRDGDVVLLEPRHVRAVDPAAVTVRLGAVHAAVVAEVHAVRHVGSHAMPCGRRARLRRSTRSRRRRSSAGARRPS